jgi:chemotaxis signal transduction protein
MADSAVRAWLVEIGGGTRVALGGQRVLEYLLSPPVHTLPRMPAHCCGVLVWREQLIPFLDLARILPRTSRAAEPGTFRAVVLAYQESPGLPLRYGALAVCSAPVETWVSDKMACALPENLPELSQFASSCFAHQQELIPVLDTKRLFTAALVAQRPWPRQDAGSEYAPSATTNPETSPEASVRASDRGSTQPVRGQGSTDVSLQPQFAF